MFCDSVREQEKNIIAFEGKMLLVTKEELKSYPETKLAYFCEKVILEKFAKEKKLLKSQR